MANNVLLPQLRTGFEVFGIDGVRKIVAHATPDLARNALRTLSKGNPAVKELYKELFPRQHNGHMVSRPPSETVKVNKMLQAQVLVRDLGAKAGDFIKKSSVLGDDGTVQGIVLTLVSDSDPDATPA